MQKNLKEIRNWTHDKCFDRLKELRELLEVKVETEVLDEAIVILLECLGDVVKEKGWDESPLDLFQGVYIGVEDTRPEGPSEEGSVFRAVGDRFKETRMLVEQFKASGPKDRKRLKPELSARGMI